MAATGRGRPRAPRALSLLLVLGLGLAACGGDAAGSGSTQLQWYVFEEPGGSFTSAAEACTEQSEGRYSIEIETLPSDADQQREQLARRLAAGDTAIDIIGMDVIWTAEFANAGWIVPWEGDRATKATEGRLDPAVQSATWQDTLWAAPFTSNAQLLWYRTDVVDEAPGTWTQLLDTAESLAEEDQPHLVQVQGQRYEGLTVFFASLVASAGGQILGDDGAEVVLDREATIRALEVMQRLATSEVAPQGLSTSLEDDNRLAFEAGDSAFMVNYPFVWPSAQENATKIAENMGWAQFPSLREGEPSHVTIGGLNLGVSSTSEHQELAFEAAACLAKPANQQQAAVKGGLLPTTESLYEEQAVKDAFPFAEELRSALQEAVQRPQTPAYADVSLAIARTIHPMRSIDPQADYERLREALERALRSEGLL